MANKIANTINPSINKILRPFDIFFEEMKTLKNKLKLNNLSMGMSSDYISAISYESTYLRIGSNIFGKRS